MTNEALERVVIGTEKEILQAAPEEGDILVVETAHSPRKQYIVVGRQTKTDSFDKEKRERLVTKRLYSTGVGEKIVTFKASEWTRSRRTSNRDLVKKHRQTKETRRLVIQAFEEYRKFQT